MEVVSRHQVSHRSPRAIENTFECDALTMDALLGLNSIGQTKLRLDHAQQMPVPKNESWQKSDAKQSEQNFDANGSEIVDSSAMEVYAPLEVVPAVNIRIDRTHESIGIHCNVEPQRERLLRLLDQQQSWYDAQQQAASAAEKFLALCEHHQQQWLQPIQQPSQVLQTKTT